MELPRNIVIGHDALLAVGEVCQALKLGKKALIVADENTIKIAGKTVEKELTGRKIRHSEYLIPDATWEEVRDGEERIRKGTSNSPSGSAEAVPSTWRNALPSMPACRSSACRPPRATTASCPRGRRSRRTARR